MATTSNPPTPTEARMLQRARWLRAMSRADREDLSELTLREVDERFDAWLGCGDEGDGEQER